MKINREKLKRIIREEISESLSPGDQGYSTASAEEGSEKDKAYDAIERNSPMDAESVREIVYYVIAEMKNSGDEEMAYRVINQYIDKAETLVLPNPYNQPRGAYRGDQKKLSPSQWIERQRRKIQK